MINALRTAEITIMLWVLFALHAVAQRHEAAFYVAPYYNSEGPTVNAGKYSQELASADKATIKTVVAAMKQDMAALPAGAMFVAAARLYNLGYRDESVHWFYATQYRARLFEALLEPGKTGRMGAPTFELRSAHSAFQQLLGEYVNGYAGCDQSQWQAALRQVQAENNIAADLSKIYPGVEFLPLKSWPAKNAEIKAGLRMLSQYLRNNWAKLQVARNENGLDKEFCQ